jgi:serine/threonine-protein kinase
MSGYIPHLAPNQSIRTDKGIYRIIQLLGKGGNSAVYLVISNSGSLRGVMLALKLFVNIGDNVRLSRFDLEVETLEKCDHPCVMKVYDKGQYRDGSDNFPFFISDYLPKTLRDAMREGIPITQKLAFVLHLLSALAYLSSLSPVVVHRDIKPENILIRGRSCMLGDFGLIKFGETEDPTMQRKVEPSTGIRFPRMYPTPDLLEYCKGRSDITPASDVFQLGLVLAELFTGNLPLLERNEPFSEVITKNLDEIRGAQGATIKGIIEKMLIPDPDKRPKAIEFFDLWEGTFREAARSAEQLEGTIF